MLSIINDKSVYGLESTYDSDSLTNAKNFVQEVCNQMNEFLETFGVNTIPEIETSQTTKTMSLLLDSRFANKVSIFWSEQIVTVRICSLQKMLTLLAKRASSKSNVVLRTKNQDGENNFEEITQNVSNEIEIIYESQEYEIATNKENTCNSINGKKAELLKLPVNTILQDNIQKTYGITRAKVTPKEVENKKTEMCSAVKKLPMNCRRPRAVVALTSSKLGEKYNLLIDQKLELIECFRKEHELRMQSLELDLALKRKQLTLLNSKDLNEMLMESQIYL